MSEEITDLGVPSLLKSSTAGDLSRALSLIQDTAIEAAGVRNAVHVQTLPREREYLMVYAGEEGVDVERHPMPPPARLHRLGSVGEVGRYAEYAGDVLGGSPVVFITDSKVMVVLDDRPQSLRQDLASVLIEPTPEHGTLKDLPDRSLNQRDLIRLLRVELSDCATESSMRLVQVARKMTATTASTMNRETRNNRESIGRDIEQEIVSAAGELPEEIALNVRLFNDPALRRKPTIRVAVEFDPATLLCQLFPHPGDLRNAIDDELQGIHTLIEQEFGGPIFLGTP